MDDVGCRQIHGVLIRQHGFGRSHAVTDTPTAINVCGRTLDHPGVKAPHAEAAQGQAIALEQIGISGRPRPGVGLPDVGVVKECDPIGMYAAPRKQAGNGIGNRRPGEISGLIKGTRITPPLYIRDYGQGGMRNPNAIQAQQDRIGIHRRVTIQDLGHYCGVKVDGLPGGQRGEGRDRSRQGVRPRRERNVVVERNVRTHIPP